MIIKTLAFVVLAFTQPLVHAWAATTLWGWFVARDLGPGPSYAAWFGISTIVFIVLAIGSLGLARTKDIKEEDDATTTALARAFGMLIGIVMIVGWAGLVGKIFGWL